MLEDFNNIEEFRKQLYEKAEEYVNSPKHKEDIKRIHRSVCKQKFNKKLKWIKTNAWNIITLVVGIITLIFAILTYLKT